MAIGGADQFQLSKWYLDAIAADGCAFIGYFVSVHWRGLGVSCAGELWSRPGVPSVSHWRGRHAVAPHVGHGVVEWLCGHDSGTWHMLEPGYEQRLYEQRGGCVDWHCITPRGRVVLRTARGHIEGSGYVEHLRCTLLPWKLPIDTLYWGRFHGAGHTITWIEWQGAHPLRLAWHNGVLDDAATTSNGTLHLPRSAARLTTDEIRIVHDAPVAGTAVEALPALASLLPRGFNAHARKYVSAARLTLSDASIVEGTSLHERVTWR